MVVYSVDSDVGVTDVSIILELDLIFSETLDEDFIFSFELDLSLEAVTLEL